MHLDDIDLQHSLEQFSFELETQREIYYESARDELEQMFNEFEGV